MSDVLNALQLPEHYRQSRAHLFASEQSLTWFIRQHRAHLIEQGALLVVAGRKYVNAGKLDAAIIDAGTAAARKLTSFARDGHAASTASGFDGH
jgi:enhancing lycopene biosynthesis protein 2